MFSNQFLPIRTARKTSIFSKKTSILSIVPSIVLQLYLAGILGEKMLAGRVLFKEVANAFKKSTLGLKHFAAPQLYENTGNVERPKLRIMEKIPQYPPNLRPPKMQKNLKAMRGPEIIHKTFLHKQYGIIAIGGGRLKAGHFEMLRLTIGRKMDINRMFAVWRVPAPWQPITKKGQGQRMGGGKGSIDHYVTPIKSGRVILEIGGKCEFEEVRSFLNQVCLQLPFKAEVLSQDIIDANLNEVCNSRKNDTDFETQYVIQNNLSGCHKWLSPVDHKWFDGTTFVSNCAMPSKFSNEEPLQLELQFANKEEDSDRSIKISEEQNLTSKQISKAICLIDEAMEIFL